MKHKGPLVTLSTILLLLASVTFAQPGRFGRTSPRADAQTLPAALVEIYEGARDATVRIETTPGGIGSGFVLSESGLVMTAYHVVREARTVSVVTADGSRYRADLIGFDEYLDVALLDIEAQGLEALPIDFTDTPEPGAAVLAIGNSRGEVIAPRAGRVVALEQELGGSFPGRLIATTMPLAPGDSGGPVLDEDGEVVGIAVAVSVGRSGFSSFATPLFGNEASEIVAALEGGLQRGVPFIGVSLLELTPETVAALGYGRPGGLLITGVVPGSGAATAGLRNPETVRGRTQADIITAVDGRRLEGHDDLALYLRGLEVGAQVELTLLRGGETVRVMVTLGTRTL